MENVLKINDLSFAWKDQKPLLNINSLHINAGEFVFLQGPSGSGKSTLLNLIAGVLKPQKGQIKLLGKDICTTTASEADLLRGSHIGFIFQSFNLVPYLNAVENTVLPCHFSKTKSKKAQQSNSIEEKARELLQALDIPKSSFYSPVHQLSVGQQQRVACARALIGSPELIIADEPTSALDTDVKDQFLELLFSVCQKDNISLLFVSHDPNLKSKFHRSIQLNDFK